LNAIGSQVVGVSADSMDIARGIGERNGEARMTVPCALASFRRLDRITAFQP
jgi:hypothetical protein